jgi:GxxExxY protein
MVANAAPIAANDDFPETRHATRSIIGAAMKVHGRLGMGFVEKVYENALAFELSRAGLKVEPQHSMHVVYEDQIVGTFAADMLVDDRVIVELKAVSCLCDEHRAQGINYLRATGLNVCMLLNFGRRRLEYKRIVCTHALAAIGVPLATIGVP